MRRLIGLGLAWVVRQAGYAWCGLWGHTYLVQREDARVSLECNWCGYAPSCGWDLRGH